MPKISVIIPVYNTSAYLRRCLDSVLRQTERDIEIICINDGSTDDSLLILQEYANKDNRVKIIDQANAGLSVARNAGISVSLGEYIMLLDSDDYIVDNAVEFLYNFAAKDDLDIVQANLIQFSDDGKNILLQTNLPAESDNVVCTGVQWLCNRYYATTAPNYICKRQFVVDNCLQFKVGIYHEDCEIIPRLLSKAKKIKGTSFGFYMYYVRPGSITQAKNIKRCFDLIKIGDSTVEYSKNIEDGNLVNFLLYYSAVVYAATVQSAVKQKIALREVFQQKGTRKTFCKKLFKFGKLKHKLMSIFIFLHLDKLFGIIYKIFMEK